MVFTMSRNSSAVSDRFRRFWYQRSYQLSTMTRSYQGHFLEFPLRDRSVPEVSLPETNTSKDAFFQNIFLEEDFLGNRDSEMKKKQYSNKKKVNFLKMWILHGSRPGKMVVFADMM